MATASIRNQPAVQSTKDYSIFKYLNGNRNIKPAHVRNMAKSMLERPNLLQYQPIIVNKEMFVIDGQHRLEACKLNKAEVFYKIVPRLDIFDVQTLNENNAGWKINDFVDSYARMGFRDYQSLKEFAARWKLPPTLAANMLIGASIHGGGKGRIMIRNGTFKIKYFDDATALASHLFDLSKYIKSSTLRSADFIRALTYALDRNLQIKTFVQKLQTHGKTIEKQGGYKQYLVAIEDVYNFHTPHMKRISIVQ